MKIERNAGKLAKEWCNKRLPLQVLESAAGFYIGTADEEGPCSRESLEYFPTHEAGTKALEAGKGVPGGWTQKETP